MADWAFRGYTRADLAAMVALDDECFAVAFRFSRGSMRRFAESPKARAVLADDSVGLAGFCVLHVEPSAHGAVGYVVTLDVAPRSRRSGLATALMQRAEAEARVAGCAVMALHVFVENAAAIAFYERIGFELSRREPGFYGEGVDALVYRKALGSR